MLESTVSELFSENQTLDLSKNATKDAEVIKKLIQACVIEHCIRKAA